MSDNHTCDADVVHIFQRCFHHRRIPAALFVPLGTCRESLQYPSQTGEDISFREYDRRGEASGEFSSNDAIFFPTPNNELESNLAMLKTLNERLIEIKGMDPKSFEYNMAIQQITGSGPIDDWSF